MVLSNAQMPSKNRSREHIHPIKYDFLWAVCAKLDSKYYTNVARTEIKLKWNANETKKKRIKRNEKTRRSFRAGRFYSYSISFVVCLIAVFSICLAKNMRQWAGSLYLPKCWCPVIHSGFTIMVASESPDILIAHKYLAGNKVNQQYLTHFCIWTREPRKSPSEKK